VSRRTWTEWVEAWEVLVPCYCWSCQLLHWCGSLKFWYRCSRVWCACEHTRHLDAVHLNTLCPSFRQLIHNCFILAKLKRSKTGIPLNPWQLPIKWLELQYKHFGSLVLLTLEQIYEFLEIFIASRGRFRKTFSLYPRRFLGWHMLISSI